MKKTVFIVILAVIFIAGCSGSSKKGKTPDASESSELTEIEKLINITDSVATEIEKTTDEIQESEASLDSLLNEL